MRRKQLDNLHSDKNPSKELFFLVALPRSGNTDKSAWKDFTGVCNQLASSTGLAAAAALRKISS